MNEQTAALLRELATKLGTTAEHLWAMLVAQAKISAFISVAYIIFFTVLSTSLVLYCRSRWNGESWKADRYEMWPALKSFWVTATSVIGGVTILVWLFGIYNIIIGLCSPEYWALNALSNLLKSGK